MTAQDKVAIVTGAGTGIGRSVAHRIVGRRAGDPVTTYADPGHAREVLGWEARHGLDEIIESALRWHERQVAMAS